MFSFEDLFIRIKLKSVNKPAKDDGFSGYGYKVIPWCGLQKPDVTTMGVIQ
jgi:hypothetical protein